MMMCDDDDADDDVDDDDEMIISWRICMSLPGVLNQMLSLCRWCYKEIDYSNFLFCSLFRPRRSPVKHMYRPLEVSENTTSQPGWTERNYSTGNMATTGEVENEEIPIEMEENGEEPMEEELEEEDERTPEE